MGLYDHINLKLYCPFCKGMMKDWQTKEFFNALKNIISQDIIDSKLLRIKIHDVCKKCHRFISLDIQRDTLIELLIMNEKKRRCKKCKGKLELDEDWWYCPKCMNKKMNKIRKEGNFQCISFEEFKKELGMI